MFRGSNSCDEANVSDSDQSKIIMSISVHVEWSQAAVGSV